jgi:undecaprenyl-diphosphatase
MDIVQALVLGLVQGATEFIPVSSSGHLVLVPWLMGWQKPALVFDTTLHLGTIVAVVAFFWRDLIGLAWAWLRSLFMRDRAVAEGSMSLPPYFAQARLAWLLIIGTTPAAMMGIVLGDFFESLFDSPLRVAVLLLLTGLILALSERVGPRDREIDSLFLFGAMLIGLAQGCAIAPGISRSGATIAMGLLLGLKRDLSARYSFLLATPIVIGAGLLQLLELFSEGAPISQLGLLALGFVAAALSGYFCIKFLLSYLVRRTLYPFALYCWLAGGICLLIALLRG